MESGKADNSLNLAVSLPEAQRQASDSLNTGYDAATKRWELIVKYNGDLNGLAGRLGFEAVLLINYYGSILPACQDRGKFRVCHTFREGHSGGDCRFRNRLRTPGF